MKINTALKLALKKTPRTSDEVDKLPEHVAIIMDGNGRWARKHKLSVSRGHRQGTETLREIIRHTDDLGIRALSLYAFSTENWNRSEEEVAALMQLMLDFFDSEIDELDVEHPQIVVGHHQDVRRFDVAVNDRGAPGVRVVERRRDGPQDRNELRDRKIAGLLSDFSREFPQRKAGNELHHEEKAELVAGVFHRVHRANVLVLKRVNDRENVFNAVHLRLVILHVAGDEFQRHVTVSGEVLRTPDRAHPALADRLDEFVIITQNEARS